MMLDEFVRKAGFESEKEFHSLVAAVDISTSEKAAAFKKWQHEDGTKAGLLNLSLAAQIKGEEAKCEICGDNEVSKRLVPLHVVFEGKVLSYYMPQGNLHILTQR